ncbi:hypothetical protein [Chitinophaga sp. LS1]|uniref:hypothetical protein n=1 Tax=Chitinophaga sp. LS1 TaxID=3051176 RepID=UPI002AAB1B2E|nr:hypothetical protein [Chitinophaga sp. LS1]WPV68114.1 hypothetical protein QQL36_05180 [Chitinophaga sp. LS1]
MKNIHKKIVIVGLVTVVAAGAIAGVRKWVSTPAKEEDMSMEELFAPPKGIKLSKEEIATLADMSKVLHQLDTLKVYTLSGSYAVQDLADSSNNMQADFFYTRQDSTAYYRIGQQEMIALSECFITVDHATRKIFLAPHKTVNSPFNSPLDEENKYIARESYHVSRSDKGGLSKVTLFNDTHVSCREYNLLFDSTGTIRQTDMRMTDPLRATDHTKDKLVVMKINNWQMGIAKAPLLRMDKYVHVRSGVITSAINDYELVRY